MARPLHLPRPRCGFYSVFATDVATSEGSSSLLLILFIGFFTLIVVFQLVPAVLLLGAMIRGLFSRQNKEEKSFNLKN